MILSSPTTLFWLVRRLPKAFSLMSPGLTSAFPSSLKNWTGKSSVRWIHSFPAPLLNLKLFKVHSDLVSSGYILSLRDFLWDKVGKLQVNFRKKEKNKRKKKHQTQVTEGWMVSQAFLSAENWNNADLVPVATVLSCKNPRKRPGKSFIPTFGYCILCLKAIWGGNIKYKAD